MESEGVVESEGEGWEWWGLMERGWRRLMERCWTSSPFVVASLWHINAVAHRCRIPWPCCCHPVLLSLARCGPILCLNEVGWGEGGTGGTYLVSTTTNDECRLSFWLPHRCRRHGTCIPRSPRGVVSICWRSFPSVRGHFHPCVVVFPYGRSFVFVAGHFRSWLLFSYVCIRGRLFTFVAGHLRS